MSTNCRVLGKESQRIIHGTPLYSDRVSVCCSLWSDSSIGSYLLRMWLVKLRK